MGTGKSWSALKIAESVDPNFTVDKVCFKASDFLKQLQLIEENRIPGQVLILDESELAAPNTSWQSVANQSLSHSLMTSRNLQCMIICVSPTFGFVDKRIRVLCDIWAHPVKQITGGNGGSQVTLFINKITTDLLGEKIWFKRLRFYNKNTKRLVIAKGFTVGRPSKELTKAYEAKAEIFKRESRTKLYAEALKAEAKEFGETNKQLGIREKVDLVLDNPAIKESLLVNKKVTPSQILYEFPNFGTNYASHLANIVNNNFGKKRVIVDGNAI